MRIPGILLISILFWQSADALPSYARQTGMGCSACHVGGMGPQLTPFGQNFKIGGYTLRKNDSFVLPLSGMLVASYEHTAKELPGPAGPHDGTNDNVDLQEASLFAAGAFTDHIGSFAQVTYSDIDRLVTLDNVDVRYANGTELFGETTTIGVSLNNNPGLQDPWNAIPAWRFPYTSSELAPAPGAATIIDGGLEHQVIGASAYMFRDQHVYVELGGYQSLSQEFLEHTNVDIDVGQLAGTAPYWRLAYNSMISNQVLMVGIFGFNAALYPDQHSGPRNYYNDMGVDMSYQQPISSEHLITFAGAFVHEKQKLDYSVSNGDSGRDTLQLNELNLNASYYYQNTYGLRLGYFRTGGTGDNILYAPSPLDGSRNGKPDSRGYILQADWTPFGKQGSWGAPWANVRIGIQYVDYLQFNGARNNYDGFGRNANDNNTVYIFVRTTL